MSVLIPTAVGFIDSSNNNEKKILGVLEFENGDNESSTSNNGHYVSSSFSNYLHKGDMVNMRGYVMEVGDWYKSLNATANVKIEGPDGSIVFEKKGITTDANNSFQTSLTITDDFKVGKYIASIVPIKEGYSAIDNEYLTIFYVMQNDLYTISQSSSGEDKPLSVLIGSIQFETSDLKFYRTSNSLSFNVSRVQGVPFAADNDLGYPGNLVFVVIEKPLLRGPFQHQVDNNTLGWSSWNENDQFSIVQIYSEKIEDNATTTIKGAD
jgi:hypothetical protein